MPTSKHFTPNLMNWSELRDETDQWNYPGAPTGTVRLKKDPGETQNVVDRHPAEADRLQSKSGS
jgi:hypothetical protein